MRLEPDGWRTHDETRFDLLGLGIESVVAFAGGVVPPSVRAMALQVLRWREQDEAHARLNRVKQRQLTSRGKKRK